MRGFTPPSPEAEWVVMCSVDWPRAGSGDAGGAVSLCVSSDNYILLLDRCLLYSDGGKIYYSVVGILQWQAVSKIPIPVLK